MNEYLINSKLQFVKCQENLEKGARTNQNMWVFSNFSQNWPFWISQKSFPKVLIRVLERWVEEEVAITSIEEQGS